MAASLPLRFKYQTIEFGGSTDIHIRTLRDHQQYSDPEGAADALGISSAQWPLFGVLWESSRVLADLMHGYDVAGRRILEVGCGIGLASLVLNHREADITATDYHPEAGLFLQENVRLNRGQEIPFVRTGWDDAVSKLGDFDLIIGSDILYEREHVELLAAFVAQHARPRCEVVIVDPGRGHHARFSRTMVGNGFTHSQYRPPGSQTVPNYKGQVLVYRRESA